MERRKSLKDILAGLIFLGIGLAFGIAASGYQIGTALRIGPGYFPLVLAVVLVGLGIAIIAKGVMAPDGDSDLGSVSWRGVVLVLGALIFFGATIRGLGFVPTFFITTFVSALASRENSPVGAALIGAVLTVFCALIFIYALGVTVPLFGPWVRF